MIPFFSVSSLGFEENSAKNREQCRVVGVELHLFKDDEEGPTQVEQQTSPQEALSSRSTTFMVCGNSPHNASGEDMIVCTTAAVVVVYSRG